MRFKGPEGNSRRLRALLLATTVIVATHSAAADAQSTAEKDSSGLQDIVVTARKRTETTQSVPVAVTALSAVQLARNDLTSIEKIAASTPQLTVGRSATGSGAQLVMRGIGSNSTSIGIEQSVAIVVDGVYYGQGRIINEGFFDLERAEILKGPQALFFGKNATAGVVSLTTASPTDKPTFIARAGYEFNARNLSGEFVGSGPLSDTLGLRVAVRGSDMFGGYFKNQAFPTTYTTLNRATGVSTVHAAEPGAENVPQTRELIGRVTLAWKPTDSFTATLKASGNINNNNNPAWNYVLVKCPTGASGRNAAVACGHDFNIYQSNLPQGIGGNIPLQSSSKLGNKYSAWQTTLNMELRRDAFVLTSVTNYNWNKNSYVCDCDFTVSNLPGNFGVEDTSFHAFSTEERILTTFDGPLNAMLGVYYQDSRRRYRAAAVGGGFDNASATDIANRYLTNRKDSATNGQTIAGFGQATWKIVPELEIAAGVRYTHETKSSYFEHPYSSPYSPAYLPNVRITADQTFDDWSPEATVTFKPTSNLTIYGGYKTAYKSGGFSNSGILSPLGTVEDFTFDPEKAKGFEGGIKSTLLDRQLRLNLAIYRYKYSNLQIDFFNSPIFAFSTINAGSAITKGVELDFEYAPRNVRGLNIHGSVNYNHARYGAFANAPCWTGQSIAQGCTTVVPRPQQDLQGAPTAMAPAWAGTMGVAYDFALNNDWDIGVSADGRYSDSYLTSSFGNPNSTQGSYAVLDASIRLKSSDDRWEVALLGKNLTNRFFITGQFDGPLTGSGTGTASAVPSDIVGFAGLPRTIQLQFTARY